MEKQKKMIAKINRSSERFIECGNCSYKRSFHLESDLIYERFDWICPSCEQYWRGTIEYDGEILIEQIEKQNYRAVVIKIPEPWGPFTLALTREETGDEAWERGDLVPDFVTDEFYLEPCEPESEINPLGLAQYRARES